MPTRIILLSIAATILFFLFLSALLSNGSANETYARVRIAKAEAAGTRDVPNGIEKRIEDRKDIPKGILKRLLGADQNESAATPEDTSAPIIFSVKAGAGDETASLRWFTSERATSFLRYGAMTAVGSTTPHTSLGWMHGASVIGLSHDTLYYYSIVATDAAGNIRETALASFRTAPTAVPSVDTTAPKIIFAIATNIGDADARIIWVTNEETSGKVYVGTTTPVPTSHPLVAKHGQSFFHEARIDGLRASTAYFFTVQSTDSSGNSAWESDTSFTTRKK